MENTTLSFNATFHRGRRLLGKPFGDAAVLLYRFTASRLHPFWIQLCYFMSLSLGGFLLLKMIPHKGTPAHPPSNLDVFFMSVSAATVSSMSTVEMEFFSNAQLAVLTILMLMGGEVFTSMLSLGLRVAEVDEDETSGKLVKTDSSPCTVSDAIELGLTVAPNPRSNAHRSAIVVDRELPSTTVTDQGLKSRAVRYLGFVVLCYILVVNMVGSSLVLVYLTTISSAGEVLRAKNIPLQSFSVFSVVSSFGNCGFIPTNENMIVFRRHSGLLLPIVLVVLSGNTLYPSLLRSAIWVLGRFTGKSEFDYLLKNHREVQYDHLLPALRCVFLAATVVGFVVVQFVLFCCLEWGSEGLKGMSSYQKLVGALFMSVNSRHSGESVVDISTVSSAVLVLYVVMMYLPPYTTFMPTQPDEEARSVNLQKQGTTRKAVLVRSLVFSHISYLAIFTILICITERKKLARDPLNFNALNIVIEVVSAYGNVGFSTGYSCGRRLQPDGDCKDMWYGFSGRWSDGGKLFIICVMFLGRLKRFGMKGGKTWTLA